MKFILVVFTLLLGQISISSAIPDPRDSVILESKFTSPIVGTSGVVRMRVWITNKDSLKAVTLALVETSISSGAYLILSYPRNVSGVVTPLTTTLQNNRIFNGTHYNSTNPDSFLLAGIYDPLDPITIEPSNFTRKPLWEIKFDSAVVNPNLNGFVRFDSGKVVQSTGFVNMVPADVSVNFGRSTVLIGTPPFLFLTLISPSQGISINQQPYFIWSPVRDSSLTILSAKYKVFISTDSGFFSVDTSPTVAETTWRKPDTLVSGQQYYWKVMAIAYNADTVFSETRFFNVAPDHPLGEFNLIYPPNRSELVWKTMIFDWTNSFAPGAGDTVKYNIYISPDSTFDTGFSQANLLANTFTVRDTVLVRGTTYFWRVRAFDTQGNSTFSNDIFLFDFLKLGDANEDGHLAPVDIVLTLYYLYLNIPINTPDVVDMNCDREWTSADLVIALNTIFLGTPPVCNP